MDVNFLKPESMYAIIAWRFPIRYILEGNSKQVQVYFHLRASFDSLQFFFHVIHLFGLSVMFFLFPNFTPELFCFLWIWFLVCPLAFFTYLLIEFSFVIFEGPVLFILLDSVQVSFDSPIFCQGPLIYLCKLFFQTCLQFCFGLFIPIYPCVSSFLNTLSCCRSFFICPSSRISHLCFVSLFGFQWAKPISSQISYTPA